MRFKILFVLAFFVATYAYSQNNATVQPKIMVVPYTAEGDDIRHAIEEDSNVRLVISKVCEAFDKRGFTTIDFIAKLKAQSSNNALSIDSQTDIRTKVIQGAGADIYVSVEYLYTPSSSGNSVKAILKAYDVSTGGALASKDAFSGQFYTEDVGRLAGAAVEKVADDFLSIIQTKFDDIVSNGKSIQLDIKVQDGSEINLYKEFNGEELADLLTDWVADHAFQNNYHVQGGSEFELIFDDIRIPLQDNKGRNYNIQQFDREIRQYIRSFGINVNHVAKNNVLVITIL